LEEVREELRRRGLPDHILLDHRPLDHGPQQELDIPPA
jgi:hypothetical protein